MIKIASLITIAGIGICIPAVILSMVVYFSERRAANTRKRKLN